MRRWPTYLMYHRVLAANECEGYPFPSLVMPADEFEQQVAWLARHAEVVTAAEAARRGRSAGANADRPVVAITFDDGYADNYVVAAPILERHGLRATFFLASDFVGTGSLLWYDHAALMVAHNDDQRLCDWAESCGMKQPLPEDMAGDRVAAWVELLKQTAPQIRRAWLAAAASGSGTIASDSYRAMRPEDAADLVRRGHEVASHSVGHEILPLLDDDALVAELERSRQAIAEWIAGPVAGFCYPNGSYDDRVVAATRAAGYGYACTTQSPYAVAHAGGGGDDMLIGRVDLNRSRVTRASGRFDLVAFRAELSGLHDWLR